MERSGDLHKVAILRCLRRERVAYGNTVKLWGERISINVLGEQKLLRVFMGILVSLMVIIVVK